MSKNRKRITIVYITFAIVVATIVLVKQFSKTEFVLLPHLTEVDSTTHEVYEVYLVKNQPDQSEKLITLIEVLNASKSTANFHRLFIKEHNNRFFDLMGDGIDYSSPKTTRDDLDNTDFLATSYRWLDFRGKTIAETACYVGELWYYKNKF